MKLFSKKIGLDEQVYFAKNLAIMLKSGIPIDESLSSLAVQVKSKHFKSVIENIKKEVISGNPLSTALAKEKTAFNSAFIKLINAGEKSGTLESNLVFLGDWLESSNDLRKEMKSATLYPKIVLAAVSVLGIGLSVFILPRLIPVFENFDIELPITTRVVLGVSIFLQEYWILTIIVAFVIVISFIFLNRLKAFKSFFELVYLKTPLLGNLLKEYQLAFIFYLLSTVFKSGLSINESLEIASESVRHTHYRESLEQIRDRAAKGTSVSETIKSYPNLYPPNVPSIVSVGERSGTLDTSFNYLAEFYTKEVRNRIKRLPLILEPVLLLTLGLVVGFIALSIITPIYQLTR